MLSVGFGSHVQPFLFSAEKWTPRPVISDHLYPHPVLCSHTHGVTSLLIGLCDCFPPTPFFFFWVLHVGEPLCLACFKVGGYFKVHTSSSPYCLPSHWAFFPSTLCHNRALLWLMPGIGEQGDRSSSNPSFVHSQRQQRVVFTIHRPMD